MATQRTMAGSALLTTALLTAVLAIIAGILGMHVLAGTHSAHSSVTASAGMPDTAGQALSGSGSQASGHGAHLAASREDALQELPPSSGAASFAQCSCSGNCSSQHSVNVACIPSVATGGLAAPAPTEALSITGQSAASTSTALAPWSYRPGSPSPGELSISRT
ncbi:DUF6153 family protein [Arthrobacter sp. M2012083]|uniref:DUF6153 family protein n=1 Tax=Arthrobacter sp. M2012083 TaxID=1197706 RepID=UPI0002FE04DB|nr:DUF6153 family protein [Arthrobacter sp. M2012083]